MIMIGEILVSEDVVQKNFLCNLSACKGACCIEGDYGAPLESDELLAVENILEKVLPYLPPASQEKIRANGFYKTNEATSALETTLMPDGACVFMGRDELGITFCGIEKAYRDGETDFKKPISCHLYPIRVSKNDLNGFQALNYDVWDICSAACKKGDKEELRIYQFVKEALIRRYGQEFYDELEAAAEEYQKRAKR